MDTVIKYLRREKRYALVDILTGGIVADAPSGEANKAILEVTQLRFEGALNDIDVEWLLGEMARRVKEYPQLQGRIFRAAQIVVGNGVTRQPDGYYVESQSEPGKRYLVNGRCGCRDFELGSLGAQAGAPILNGSACCKHRLAVQIVEAMERGDYGNGRA